MICTNSFISVWEAMVSRKRLGAPFVPMVPIVTPLVLKIIHQPLLYAPIIKRIPYFSCRILQERIIFIKTKASHKNEYFLHGLNPAKNAPDNGGFSGYHHKSWQRAAYSRLMA